MNTLHIYYRLSDKGETKDRLSYLNNKVCFENFLREFSDGQITIIADNVTDETARWLQKYDITSIYRTYLGNSGSFWFAYKLALQQPANDYIYFVENDYLHKPGARNILNEGLEIADYVTLYDHPDKYIKGFNPHVHKGGERSIVLLTDSSHWKKTNSTTMTFASKVHLLQKDRLIFKLFTIGLIRQGGPLLKKISERKIPADYNIFIFLTRCKSRLLISPLPGFSTHGETKFLSPLVDWQKYVNSFE